MRSSHSRIIYVVSRCRPYSRTFAFMITSSNYIYYMARLQSRCSLGKAGTPGPRTYVGYPTDGWAVCTLYVLCSTFYGTYARRETVVRSVRSCFIIHVTLTQSSIERHTAHPSSCTHAHSHRTSIYIKYNQELKAYTIV